MKYLNSLNHYRALAIIFIVAVHSVSTADVNLDSYTNRFLLNIISGSTLNFSFISGFLFYLVLYKKYEYSSFFKARIDRFLKPYLFLSILPILVCLVITPMYWDNSNLVSYSGNNMLWYTISIFKYIVSGAHITAYWYIPFVMIMAIMSPWHVAFIKLKLKQQLVIISGLIIIASIMQRPYERTYILQALHSVVYFTPLYLMGITCAIQKDRIYKLLKGKEIYLLAIVLLFVILQTNLGDVGLYKNKFLAYNGIDTLVFKMVFVCLFFMIWLHRYEHVRNQHINTLANTSFAIYFLHVYFLKLLDVLKGYFDLNFDNYSAIAYIAVIVFSVVASMFTSITINKVIPNYSFLLIGYGKKPSKVSKDVKLPQPAFNQ